MNYDSVWYFRERAISSGHLAVIDSLHLKPSADLNSFGSFLGWSIHFVIVPREASAIQSTICVAAGRESG